MELEPPGATDFSGTPAAQSADALVSSTGSWRGATALSAGRAAVRQSLLRRRGLISHTSFTLRTGDRARDAQGLVEDRSALPGVGWIDPTRYAQAAVQPTRLEGGRPRSDTHPPARAAPGERRGLWRDMDRICRRCGRNGSRGAASDRAVGWPTGHSDSGRRRRAPGHLRAHDPQPRLASPPPPDACDRFGHRFGAGTGAAEGGARFARGCASGMGCAPYGCARGPPVASAMISGADMATRFVPDGPVERALTARCATGTMRGRARRPKGFRHTGWRRHAGARWREDACTGPHDARAPTRRRRTRRQKPAAGDVQEHGPDLDSGRLTDV